MKPLNQLVVFALCATGLLPVASAQESRIAKFHVVCAAGSLVQPTKAKRKRRAQRWRKPQSKDAYGSYADLGVKHNAQANAAQPRDV